MRIDDKDRFLSPTNIRGFKAHTGFAWPLVELGDIVTLHYGKSLTVEKRSTGTIPVFGTNGITGWHNQALAHGPTVILGRKGMGNLGVEWCDGPFWVIDTAYYTTIDETRLDYQYFYYFTSYVGLNHLKDGTSNPSLTRDRFGKQFIPLPPLPEQRAIAHILGSLDDKIEANRRMNATLEATARALFKSWFVDFDPVHAKARGEQPTGMDAATAALFPDHFEDSELGPIPAGWRIESIGDHVRATKGLSYKGDFLVDSIEDGIPMHNLNSINEWGTYKFDGIKFYSGEYQARHEVKPGDLIVANTEQGFDLLLIASPAIVPATFGQTGIISHHVYKVEIRRKSPLTRLFLYYQIMMSPFRDLLQGYTNGTTVNMLPADAFERPQFVMPPAELMQRFDEVIEPMLEQIERNYEQSRTLAETRDALLPRLVSGELRVGEM